MRWSTFVTTTAVGLAWATLASAQAPQVLHSGEALEVAVPGHPNVEPREMELEFTAACDGTLHAWASSSDFDPVLRVIAGDGEVLASNDDGGGGTSALLAVELTRGQRIAILLGGGAGRARVQVTHCPPDPAVDAAEGEARAALESAQELARKGDAVAASSQIARGVEVLCTVPGIDCDPRALGALSQLGFQASILGDVEASLRAREAVARGLATFLPPQHPKLLAARSFVAWSLRTLGQFERALQVDEEVLAGRKLILAEDDPDVLWAMHSLAWSLSETGGLARALELQERVVAIRARTLPEQHGDRLWSELMLGRYLERSGQVPRALELLERVERERARTLPEDHFDRMYATKALGWTLAQAGQLARAKDVQERVLAAFQRTLPADHPHVADAMSDLAWTLHELGDGERALRLQERALTMKERGQLASERQVNRFRNNLALILMKRGDLQRARLLQERVLEYRERVLSADDPELLGGLNNFGIVLYRLGDLERARMLQARNVSALMRTRPAGSPDAVGARVNLASMLIDQDELEQAEALLRGALADGEGVLAATHPFLEFAAELLSWILVRQGRVDEALTSIEAQLERNFAVMPADDPRLIATYARLGSAYHAAGRYTEALEMHGRSLAMAESRSSQDHFMVIAERANVILDLLRLERHEHAREQALIVAESLTREFEQSMLVLAPRESEARVDGQANYTSVVMRAALAERGADGTAELDRAAFELAEVARSSRLASLRSYAELSHDETLSLRAGELRGEIRRRASEVASAAVGSSPSRDQYEAALMRKESLERELLEVLGTATSGRGRGSFDADAVRGALAPGEAAIGFWASEAGRGPERMLQKHLTAFVLAPDLPVELVDLGELEPIELAIARWREAVLAPTDRGGAVGRDRGELERECGAELARLLVAPLRQRLALATRWYVASYGALHLLPLDALPDGTGEDALDRRLGDVLEIANLPALSTLTWHKPEAAGAASLLVAGGIEFDATAEDSGPAGEPVVRGGAQDRAGAWELGFAPLPESDAEAKTIEALFRKSFTEPAEVRRLSGRAASRAALEVLAPRARYLHLATHGFFAPETIASTGEEREKAEVGSLSIAEEVRGMSPMLLCGLALAGANLPPDAIARQPGVITAEELASIDLSSCELAVLSACDTHVGLRRGGAGIASLQTALHAAGARTSITSLWKVPDEATKDLMVDFYRRIWVERKPPRQALWEAKRKLRERRDPDGGALYTTRDWAAWSLCATGH